MTVLRDVIPDAHSDIFGAFQSSARKHSERIALKAEGGRGKRYSYGELLVEVGSLAQGLSAERFAAIEEVGLLAENRPEWPMAYLGIVGAGKTVVPLDANLKTEELRGLIHLAGIRLLFISARFTSLLEYLPDDLIVYCFDGNFPEDWRQLFPAVSETPPSRQPHNPAALIYTSGTTGAPKAAMLSHRNLLSNAEGALVALDLFSDDVFLSVLPLHHTFEATCGFLVPLLIGSCIVYARSLKSRQIVEDIQANGVTVLLGVPLLFEKVYHGIIRSLDRASWPQRTAFRLTYRVSAFGLKRKKQWGHALFASLRRRAGMSSIRLFVSGGAALPPEIGRFFNLIGIKLLQGYGMTECSPVISVNRPDDNRFGSVGPPIPNVEVRIDAPDKNGIGEILVRGENVMLGYKDNPEKTAEILREGWLHTGDLGRIEDGHLWIVGRAKNVIVSAAGKNIYPEELEEKLLTSEFILESVVFGRQREGRQGEDICAVIVPDLTQFEAKFGMSPDEPDTELIDRQIEQAVSEVNNQVADFKRINSFDIQLEELDKTSTKKVKRFVYTK